MKGDEQIHADCFVKLAKSTFVPVLRAQVIARRKSVLRIETDAQPLRGFGSVNNLSYLLEAVPQVRALTGSDLDGEFGGIARARLVHLVNRLRNRFDTSLFTCPYMSAWVCNKIGNTQCFTPLHFVDKT